MAKATGKDYAQIKLDIWGNDDWLDLSPPAQHLYFVLWTSPELSYCGTGEWHPGKIAAKAKGWTPDGVCGAAVELSRELFLLVDLNTDEFILRSWIKHDGLWRSPTMAVSMVNARAALASRTLRGVIVHEVSKLKDRESSYSSWSKDAVVQMLSQKAVDPETADPYTGNSLFDPTANPWLYPPSNPWPDPPSNGYGHLSPNPPSYPPRTPAPAPAPISNTPIGVTSVGNGTSGAHDDEPPPRICSRHPNGTDKPCRECQAIREAEAAQAQQQLTAKADRLQAFWAEVRACDDCDEKGHIQDGRRNAVAKCQAHDWEVINA